MSEAGEAPFARCLDADGPDFGDCLYREAKEGQLWDQGRGLLVAHLQEFPDDYYSVFHLATFSEAIGDGRRAIEEYDRAAMGLEQVGDTLYAAYARLNQSESLRWMGRLAEAEAEMERANALALASGNHRLVIETRLRSLRIARSRGVDLEGIRIQLLQLEDEIFRDPGYPYSVRRTWLFDLGALLLTLHRLDEAEAIYRRWDRIAAEEGDTYGQATARVNSATAVSEMVWRESAASEALQLAREGLGLSVASGQAYVESEALRLLGKLTPGEEGRSHLRRCLSKSSAGTTARSLCHFALAGSLSEDDPDLAGAVLVEALLEAETAEDPWSGILSWDEHFRVLWSTLPRDEAFAGSRVVLDRIEELRRLQDSESGRVEVFASVAHIYRALTGYVLSEPREPSGPLRVDLVDAFAVSERMRARVLLDGLRDADVEVGEELLETPGDFASLSDLESTLAENEAAFVFQVAPERDVFGKQAGGSWLMVATRDGTRVYRLPDGSDIENMVAMLMGLLEDGSGDQQLVEDVSEALADRLFADARAGLPPDVDSWILVPDGLLHLVPFAQLVPDTRLSTVPSVTLWQRWHRSAEGASPAALAFADPKIGEDDETSGEIYREAAERLADLEGQAELGRLPHARREGRRLVRQLGGGSRLLVDAEATEAALKSASHGDFGILHFATHALLDIERPHRSAIVLAPGGSGGEEVEEDGLLQPREIAALPLDGKLVVLSACQSASGKAQHGEGVESLARAFFQAGARTVVASLWRLRDDHAATYFDAFYRHLSDGRTVSEASAATVREQRASGAPPSAWAGVVVLGDGEWSPVPDGRRGLPGWLVLVLVAGGVGLGVMVLRLRS